MVRIEHMHAEMKGKVVSADLTHRILIMYRLSLCDFFTNLARVLSGDFMLPFARKVNTAIFDSAARLTGIPCMPGPTLERAINRLPSRLGGEYQSLEQLASKMYMEGAMGMIGPLTRLMPEVLGHHEPRDGGGSSSQQ